jgi:hypothetical protein
MLRITCEMLGLDELQILDRGWLCALREDDERAFSELARRCHFAMLRVTATQVRSNAVGEKGAQDA